MKNYLLAAITCVVCLSTQSCSRTLVDDQNADDANRTVKRMEGMSSDAERHRFVIAMRVEQLSIGEQRGLAKYYIAHPEASGTLRLGILATLGDVAYDESSFCRWLLDTEGLSKERELRGYAWYYLGEKIKYKASEDELKKALNLSLEFPGTDVDGSTRTPDKLCIELIQELGALHYPAATWWK